MVQCSCMMPCPGDELITEFISGCLLPQLQCVRARTSRCSCVSCCGSFWTGPAGRLPSLTAALLGFHRSAGHLCRSVLSWSLRERLILCQVSHWGRSYHFILNYVLSPSGQLVFTWWDCCLLSRGSARLHASLPAVVFQGLQKERCQYLSSSSEIPEPVDRLVPERIGTYGTASGRHATFRACSVRRDGRSTEPRP